jgi:hypothetical protein
MQVFIMMTLLNIVCNMQNMQNNMHDMQNMQTLFPICRICTAHFADGAGGSLTRRAAAAPRRPAATVTVGLSQPALRADGTPLARLAQRFGPPRQSRFDGLNLARRPARPLRPPTRRIFKSGFPCGLEESRLLWRIPMTKSRNFVHRASDRFVVFATEIGKGTVREAFRVGTQLADSFSAALIQIASDNETYYAARRNRIHPGPEIIRRPRAKLRSGFADLYDRDDERDDCRSTDSSNAEGTSALLILSEPSFRHSIGGGGRDCEFSDTASFMTERPLHRRITRCALQSVRWGLARGRSACLPPHITQTPPSPM